ncbi:uncharacterized protein CANTADRAFT_89783 [Suhomyces tanzawaensis NRRL Y-17324]|uniref:Autophagy-related protein 101 n=1 Tax=Suhomyces tanzawaensis NRRL Y-17324 TaxID=984487 RepID=A0A1E4SL42_9ASCO|nr:uncharacterized protein CANTADRAFT_89783 [Suhomyces tanzawaensis NRRL Y-17324]ODV80208.1 hypothetical protein CANTADRAFT_89783 [Suhomyces tanzawaensis NRRL Y-17324]
MEYTLYLTAERSVVRESLKGVIWTIFFNRLFGPITPTTNEFLSVTYSMAENLPELDTLIDEKVNQLIKLQFDTSNQGVSHGHVIVQFLDKKAGKSKRTGWFGKSETSDDLKLWESWIVSVECLPMATSDHGGDGGPCLNPQDKNRNIEVSIQSFEENLHKIFTIVDSHKDHIPPITSLESLPFPYTIDVERNLSKLNYATEGNDSWGGYIKKMLD